MPDPAEMPEADCPVNCDPEICKSVWTYWNTLWQNCLGDPTCQASIEIQYKQDLQNQCNP